MRRFGAGNLLTRKMMGGANNHGYPQKAHAQTVWQRGRADARAMAMRGRRRLVLAPSARPEGTRPKSDNIVFSETRAARSEQAASA